MTEQSHPAPNAQPSDSGAAGHVTSPTASTGLDSHQALEFVAKVLVAGVPILYLLGRVYLEGYWSQLGLQGPSDVELADYLYFGFFALLSGIIDAVGMTGSDRLYWIMVSGVGLMVFTAVVVLLGHWLGEATRSALAKLDAKARAWNSGNSELARRVAEPVALVGSGFYALLGACLLLLLLVIVLLAGAQNVGQARGREVLARFQSDTVGKGKSPPPVVRYRDPDGAVRVGKGLLCSTAWCYVYRDDRFIVVPAAAVLQIDSGVIAPRKPVPAARVAPAASRQ
jgi:hypothetical protein